MTQGLIPGTPIRGPKGEDGPATGLVPLDQVPAPEDNVSMANHELEDLATPTSDAAASTKGYGDTTYIHGDGTNGDYRYQQTARGPSAIDMRYGCVPNAVQWVNVTTSRTVGDGKSITFGNATLTPDRVGQTIVIRSAGVGGDSFVTTIDGYTDASHGHLAAVPTTDVVNGTVRVGTDNRGGLKQLLLDLIQGSVDGLIPAGSKGILPPGNFLATELWSDPAIALALHSTNKGVDLHGAGGGSTNLNGLAQTSIWYAGTGSSILLASALGAMYGVKMGGFAIWNLRPIGAGVTNYTMYIENPAYSSFRDIQLIGADTPGSNANQGSGLALMNPSTGLVKMDQIHIRNFDGPDSRGCKLDTDDTPYGGHGDCGGVELDTMLVFGCTIPWDLAPAPHGGVIEASQFNNLKAVGSGVNGPGFLLGQGLSGCTLIAPHSEGYRFGITFRGCRGCTIIAGIESWGYGVGLPTAPSATQHPAGGALVGGGGGTTFDYIITAINAIGGESAPIAVLSATIGAGVTTGSVELDWVAPAGGTPTGYNIYGRTHLGTLYLMKTVGAVLTYTDTGVDVPDGVTVPPSASACFNFNNATGNIVVAGDWYGWGAAGQTGAPGFDYVAIYDAGSSGNRVHSGPGNGFTFPGIQFVLDLGVGNVTKNLGASNSVAVNAGGLFNWTTIKERIGWVGSALAAGTYLIGNATGSAVLAQGGVNTGVCAFYVNPALYAPGSMLRFVSRLITNALAPGQTFSFAIWPVNAFGGAVSAAPTVATVLGSIATAAIAGATAGGGFTAQSSPVPMPATAGWYVMGFVLGGATAATSEETVEVELLVGQPV